MQSFRHALAIIAAFAAGQSCFAETVPLKVEPRPVPYASQSVADLPPGEVLALALNKARPLDLPGATQDVVVGNPAIADVVVRSTSQVFLTGRAIGDTNVFFLDARGQLLRRVEIHVGPDAEGAHAAIAQLLPNDDIRVASVGDSLFLTGKARSPDVVSAARTIARRFVANDANVVNQITMLGAQQVMLRVRVAEMNRDLVKQLGIRTFLTQNGKQVAATMNGGSTSGVSPGGIGSQNPNYQFPVTSPSSAGSLPVQSQGLFGSLPGTGNVLGGGGEYSTLAGNNPGSWVSVLPWNMLINYAALEQEGLAKSLAEPNLVTLSGEAARFLVGGEIPVPSASTNGVVTVDWKPFGVGLVFSPVILNNGQISLKLESEVSAIDSTISVSTGQGLTVPGFTTRRATTAVELPSGGSLMIAGLMQDNLTSGVEAIPGLRDIPVLGALMGSTAYQRHETELVITVTAYLVNPVGHNSMELPTDGFLPASDLNRYLLMSLQDTYVGKQPGLSPSALKGPVGYIVD
jgi:pilus assembly protein CpaC